MGSNKAVAIGIKGVSMRRRLGGEFSAAAIWDRVGV
jgi:hypothetical protein